jgi:predicted dehydrogenase
LDGVAICAASSAHEELIGRAQDAGLTTFCVKPLASDLAGTLRITERLADAMCRFTSASGVALTPASAPPAMR